MTKHSPTHTTPTEHSDLTDQRIFPLGATALEEFDMLLDQPVDTEELQAFLHAPTIFGTEIVLN
ncbi:hypothetical protein N24_1770 [Corynebacterium suranareeae]|uniref:Uncharacterized protein n=1 Tax=Corynebacterium suranareeae TaxID=2506452 RepID=A0A169RXU4_9CORY|nr:hypothetical protein [Corynebacterium suranareeae]BAU96032.1 hypothetical protein N24_1770 [Corynebacterium suranareeae]